MFQLYYKQIIEKINEFSNYITEQFQLLYGKDIDDYLNKIDEKINNISLKYSSYKYSYYIYFIYDNLYSISIKCDYMNTFDYFDQIYIYKLNDDDNVVNYHHIYDREKLFDLEYLKSQTYYNEQELKLLNKFLPIIEKNLNIIRPLIIKIYSNMNEESHLFTLLQNHDNNSSYIINFKDYEIDFNNKKIYLKN